MANSDEKAVRFIEFIKQKSKDPPNDPTDQEVRDFVKQKQLEKEWTYFER